MSAAPKAPQSRHFADFHELRQGFSPPRPRQTPALEAQFEESDSLEQKILARLTKLVVQNG